MYHPKASNTSGTQNWRSMVQKDLDAKECSRKCQVLGFEEIEQYTMNWGKSICKQTADNANNYFYFTEFG